jgi:hypothetical protein
VAGAACAENHPLSSHTKKLKGKILVDAGLPMAAAMRLRRIPPLRWSDLKAL